MKVAAAEFKARCLAFLDEVHEKGHAITITKRGRVVARLVPADEDEQRPWMRIRGAAKWVGDPIAPVVEDDDIDAIR